MLCGGQRLEYFGNSAAEAWLLLVFSLVSTKILGTRRELLLLPESATVLSVSSLGCRATKRNWMSRQQ